MKMFKDAVIVKGNTIKPSYEFPLIRIQLEDVYAYCAVKGDCIPQQAHNARTLEEVQNADYDDIEVTFEAADHHYGIHFFTVVK